MNKPTLRPDGSCPACSGGWQCTWHQLDGVRADKARGAMLRSVAASQRAAELARICSRFELESDEFQTREEKAEAFL